MFSKDKKNQLIYNLVIFIKGMFMGIADLVPGISGGTIAFISGIYERLINAITNITPKNKYNLIKLLIKKDLKKFNELFLKLDYLFLLILFAGVFTSILTFSKIILFFYNNYNSYLLIFFIGLILASSKIIYQEIPIHKIFNITFGIGGFLLGLTLLYLSPQEVLNPSYLAIFCGGFLAVFALFLPGVSGSFILLILGLYGFILEALQDIFSNITIFLTFLFGAIFGVFLVSRLIKYLFKQDKSKTLYILLGLVLGSLIIPISQVQPNINTQNIIIHIILLLFGIFSVFLINKLAQKIKSSSS